MAKGKWDDGPSLFGELDEEDAAGGPGPYPRVVRDQAIPLRARPSYWINSPKIPTGTGDPGDSSDADLKRMAVAAFQNYATARDRIAPEPAMPDLESWSVFIFDVYLINGYYAVQRTEITPAAARVSLVWAVDKDLETVRKSIPMEFTERVEPHASDPAELVESWKE